MKNITTYYWKRIILLSLFFYAAQSFAQNGKLYKGTIGNTLKITFYIENTTTGTYADPIIGAYKYDNQKEYFLLNGYQNHDGNISMVEMATANFSGTFLGTLLKNQLTGKWVSADHKKVLNFDLIEIAATKEQLALFKKNIKQKTDQFSAY